MKPTLTNKFFLILGFVVLFFFVPWETPKGIYYAPITKSVGSGVSLSVIFVELLLAYGLAYFLSQISSKSLFLKLKKYVYKFSYLIVFTFFMFYVADSTIRFLDKKECNNVKHWWEAPEVQRNNINSKKQNNSYDSFSTVDPIEQKNLWEGAPLVNENNQSTVRPWEGDPIIKNVQSFKP